ncbi:cation-transporting P-type ATPase [Desulfuribacillus alkaliarsenatis]|uniref:P-type Ca(2+) transporter n=1 Tax=Desulfuribacillus alkaliarsenatis TaxID=766136 RepID=A0A1E5G2Y2_9FIRM|nr:cation-transporting P-type ATPase [Desulfuribacillus alkaliarsenatis]OEF97418.1 carbonate dehydratase [Desulfuribacillus alkaliarsenatis]
MSAKHKQEQNILWHTLDIDKIKEQLETDPAKGLTKAEASERLQKYGANELPSKAKKSVWIKFFKHFHDVLIYILLVAAVVTALMGHYIDTAVIFAVAFINACIGFFQENKAEQALEGIKKMLSLHANVLRDGERIEIDSQDVVPGDIVFLRAGNKIPADIRLIKADKLKIEESALTGESTSVEKQTNVVDEDAVIGDRSNMAFSGTSIASGTGQGIVIATGRDTELGKISKSMAEVEQLQTPLLRQITQFGKQVAMTILVIAALMYGFGYLVRDYGPVELMLYVIGLAVAAIPEGLPAIVSIILAIGVQNMANRKAIVRNLPSVETLGAVTVICSDKTGTLTKNEMTVTSVITVEQHYEVTGTGYAPEGKITMDNKEVSMGEEPDLNELLRIVKTCNDASLRKDEDGHWKINGEPTEGCLITLAEKADKEIERFESISKIPFDSEHKYMAVLVENDGQKYIYVKGAPDRLFSMAESGNSGDSKFDRNQWEQHVKELAEHGLRVIGAGYKKVSSDVEEIHHEDIETGVEMVGLAGIIDPPREEAISAIRECKGAGITVKMITGDHKDTAVAIGKMMGIGDGELALEGKDINNMTDEELEHVVEKYDVFARTSPEHKLRLVKALQKLGHVCAMTGDGVNDAPALKRADIGVAMGIKGTEVSKDAAEMVLVDDNFETIVNAVEEGRRVYNNLKKTILFILPTNGAQAFLIMASILFGLAMPITPVQILWVNMVIAITLSLALAFERLEDCAMELPPRPMKTPLLSGYYIFRIIFVSILIGGGTLAFSMELINRGYDQAVVQTITLHTIVILQLFHLFNCRSEHSFAFNKRFFSNKAAFIVSGILLVLQAGILYLPFMNTLFGTTPLGWEYWLIPMVLGAAVFTIIEVEKWITRIIIKSRNKDEVIC